MLPRRLPLLLLGMLTVLWAGEAAPAKANADVWTAFESRLALPTAAMGGPQELRVFHQYRFGPAYGGLGQALLRVGPVWEVSPYGILAAHLTNAFSQVARGGYERELRLELEGTLRGQLGDMALSDRNRLEHSTFADRTRWRYRNRLQAGYAPPDWAWTPFVYDEAFWVLGGDGLSENRFMVGVSHPFNATDRLDMGYLLRAEPGAWTHVGMFTWFFGAPQAK